MDSGLNTDGVYVISDQRTYLVCASARREETWILGCGRINARPVVVVRSIELWLGLRVEFEVREENVREDRGEDWSLLLELALLRLREEA